MDYKKILPNQDLRLKILNLLDFIPDIVMIPIQYRIKTNRTLNLKKPKRYTEKLQWYKLNYRDPLMTKAADKYAVREYISSKKLDKILVPLYGVYDDANDIDFTNLPQQFVMKINNGSGTNIICKSKDKLNFEETRETLNYWLNKRSSKLGREWVYYDIKPKIIIEKYLEQGEEHDIIDYKFFCFDGQPHFFNMVTEHFDAGGSRLGTFDLELNQIDVQRDDTVQIKEPITKPDNFDEMINIAKILSEDFPHVRVDLYNIEGIIYFGELTFYDCSGYQNFIPDEYDYIIGNKMKLPKTK